MQVELRPDLSTANPDQAVVVSARGDYMEESVVGKSAEDVMDGQEKDQEEFIEKIIKRGHFGPFEHPQVFFAIEGISVVAERQLIRHRHLSFDVQSQRYVDFSNKEPVIPESFEDNTPFSVQSDEVMEERYDELVGRYEASIENDIPKEDARFFLPMATPVNMCVSGNLRSFFHVIDMRHAGNAQWEVREVAERMLEELEEFAPVSVEKYKQYAKGASKKAP